MNKLVDDGGGLIERYKGLLISLGSVLTQGRELDHGLTKNEIKFILILKPNFLILII